MTKLADRHLVGRSLEMGLYVIAMTLGALAVVYVVALLVQGFVIILNGLL
ncbi:MAG: hypothetical protein HYS89_01090 [Candidatus Colwellbacteria bacterium]|nr:hypothetical protein [Candidatus Colwellbacteria bacterium]